MSRKKIILLILGCAVLLFLALTSWQTSSGSDRYPDLKFYDAPYISKVIIRQNQTTQTLECSPKGETLLIKAGNPQIDIPWTRYLPVFQFGTIQGQLPFEASIGDQILGDSEVSLSNSQTRLSLLPDFKGMAATQDSLVQILTKAIQVRIREGNDFKVRQEQRALSSAR